MSNEPLPWFRCYPSKLLGAIAGMPPDKGYVYMVVLLRIYEVGGPCRDDSATIARRTGIAAAKVARAIDALVEDAKLVRSDAGLSSPFADRVLSETSEFRDGKVRAGKKGAAAANEKRKKFQRTEGGTAEPLPSANGGYKEIDSVVPNGTTATTGDPELDFGAIPSRPKPDVRTDPEGRPSAAMINPPLDPEADLYRRGKEVLGASSGGMIRNLLAAKGGNVALARAAIEMAATRGDARQYVGAMIRGRGAGGGGNGAAALLRTRMEARAAAQVEGRH